MNTQPNLRLYAFALHLYPATFRARYADEMLDAARHEFARSPNPLRFTASLAADTLRGALREHLRAASPTRPAYVAAFALFFTFLLIITSVVGQQILRRGADRRPAFIAAFVARRSPQDEAIARMLASPKQEISSPTFLNNDNQIFTVLYDPSGQPVAGNAILHGTLPRLPHGVFNTIRDRREFRVTWQPRVGIRVALTGDVLPSGGFVVAGQSLINSESREIRFHSLLLWIWLFAMLACCALVLFARKPTSRTTP